MAFLSNFVFVEAEMTYCFFWHLEMIDVRRLNTGEELAGGVVCNDHSRPWVVLLEGGDEPLEIAVPEECLYHHSHSVLELP